MEPRPRSRPRSRPRAPSSVKDRRLPARAPPRRARSVSAVSRCSDDVSHYSKTTDNPLFSSTSSSPQDRNSEGGGVGSCGRGLQRWTDRHAVEGSWETATARNWEDRISTSSFSEAEEVAVRVPFQSAYSVDDGVAGEIYETVRSEVRRAVSEIRDDIENAIMRKSPGTVTTKSIADIPQGLMNASLVDFVSDIKREYATKLEQSQERARKLRADLAVEEQRGQELSKILDEIVPDSKSSETRKPRPRRKASIERAKMSRLLAEEAMNYFDECVSISTFESSDFSSVEDPHLGLANGIPSMANSRFFPAEASASNTVTGHQSQYEEVCSQESDYETSCSRSIAGSEAAMNSSCSRSNAVSLTPAKGSHGEPVVFETPKSESLEFSFTRQLTETGGVNDIQHYIKKFGKEFRKESVSSLNARSSYNDEDYDNINSAESLLYDRVVYSNRIGSGGLLLCDIRTF